MSVNQMFVNFALASLVFLAAVVGLQAIPEPSWATLSDFSAAWDEESKMVDIRLVVDKRRQCQATPIAKFLTPLEGNDVMALRIPVNGHLSSKINRLPVGKSEVLDRAQPRSEVAPGRYKLSLIANCELAPAPDELVEPQGIPASPQWLASNEVTIPVEVRP